jgi:hypothetical protein
MHNADAVHAAARRGFFHRLRSILLRRVWLPKLVYEALPYMYIACGLAALTAAVYVPDWTWILPWAVLVGLLCLHAGLALATLRYRLRRRGRRRERSETA